MTKFFAKKLNKKGFTLAEMLIVVAIIAILVAIAVPLFTSQLQKAKVARDEANIRAVKSAAIVALLNYDKADLSVGSWTAKANVDNHGNINQLKVVAYEGETGVSKAGGIDYNVENTTDNVIVTITSVDISSAATTVSVVS